MAGTPRPQVGVQHWEPSLSSVSLRPRRLNSAPSLRFSGSSDNCGNNGIERGPSPGTSTDSQEQEEGPFLWESGFRSRRACGSSDKEKGTPHSRCLRGPRGRGRPCSRPRSPGQSLRLSPSVWTQLLLPGGQAWLWRGGRHTAGGEGHGLRWSRRGGNAGGGAPADWASPQGRAWCS